MVCQIPGGLSVENSALIARIANNSNSQVTIEYKGNIYTAHSIIKLLSIDIEKGDLVIISADGKDAEETVRNIGVLMEDVPDYMHSSNCQTSLV
ncbi:MAG: HPr family phosphocarrier protein [Nitrospira sp.]|nr:HPr family phosphocarrier protein [Nitrospira sp.]